MGSEMISGFQNIIYPFPQKKKIEKKSKKIYHNLTKGFFDSPWVSLILGLEISRLNLRDTKLRPLSTGKDKKMKFQNFGTCLGESKK